MLVSDIFKAKQEYFQNENLSSFTAGSKASTSKNFSDITKLKIFRKWFQIRGDFRLCKKLREIEAVSGAQLG